MREYTAADVARLRALPDSEIAALFRHGDLEAWHIACGNDPTPKASSTEPAPEQPVRCTRYDRLAQAMAMCDPGELVIEWIASTPRPSTHGYALASLGVEYELP